jgi:hypothetical protein
MIPSALEADRVVIGGRSNSSSKFHARQLYRAFSNKQNAIKSIIDHPIQEVPRRQSGSC